MKHIFYLLLIGGLAFGTPLSAQNTVKPLSELMAIKTPEDLEAAKKYIRDTLLFDQLQQSGLWKEYIQNWVALFMYSTNSQTEFFDAFVPQATAVLGRTIPQNKQVALQLTNDLIDFFETYGWDDASARIALYAFESGLRGDRINKLAVAAKLTGQPAPAIKGVPSLKKSLLIFYESGCDNCDEQIKLLKEVYPQLKAKGYQIVSVSSDEDKEVFEFHARAIPWKYNVCDYKGLDAGNFMAYGVIGTPTLYVTDANGKIVGRYALLQDALNAMQ